MLTTQECRIGDVLKLSRDLPDESIDTIVTSPPYWGLRDYGVGGGQIGLEATLEGYHKRLLEVTAECMRVLKPTGVMFWNHGDSYGGGESGSIEDNKASSKGTGATSLGKPRPSILLPKKCMIMQNERLIIRMIDDQGWILRNRIIWNKPNGMPSSVTDRFSNKYEPVYMLVKSKKYWFDLDAVRKPYTEPMNRWGGQKLKANGKSEWDKGTGQESYRDRDMRPNPLGKNPGDVWTIPTQPYPESHFATFPTALIEPMIKAACPAEICQVCGMASGEGADHRD